MYDNIGKKIKGLAKVVFFVEAIAAVVAGIVLMTSVGFAPIGLIVVGVGPIVAWVSSWVLYGFGELIDKTSDIARNIHGGERELEEQSRID